MQNINNLLIIRVSKPRGKNRDKKWLSPRVVVVTTVSPGWWLFVPVFWIIGSFLRTLLGFVEGLWMTPWWVSITWCWRSHTYALFHIFLTKTHTWHESVSSIQYSIRVQFFWTHIIFEDLSSHSNLQLVCLKHTVKTTQSIPINKFYTKLVQVRLIRVHNSES